jgi:hypothetical protein
MAKVYLKEQIALHPVVANIHSGTNQQYGRYLMVKWNESFHGFDHDSFL